MTAGYFVAGTDTGVGKTEVALGLMHGLQARGLRVAAMKPVAAGCGSTPAGLRSDDALRLQAQCSMPVPYECLNPYAFAAAVAPHIAAREAGVRVDLGTIQRRFGELAAVADCVVVEGVGGWQVPVNRDQTMADLARALGLPVVLVVGLRLGCLNHALLSNDAILAHGLPCAGWVANRIDPAMERPQDNVEALRTRLVAPLLGVVPHLRGPAPAAVAAHLRTADLPST